MSQPQSVAERDEAYAGLISQIAEVCGVLNVAHARLVALTAQAIDQELWQGWGIRSLEHFLCWQAGLSPSRAHQIADIARRYDELPETIEAFTNGELSVDQVATVAQRIPAHHDESAAQLARSATVMQLRRVLVRRELDDAADVSSPPDALTADAEASVPAPGETAQGEKSEEESWPDPALASAQLSMGDDGTRFFLHLDAPIDQGHQVRQALAEARDRLRADDPAADWADALLDVCERAANDRSLPRSRRDRYRLYLHLDIERTRDRAAHGWVNQGPALPPALRDRLTCDGVVVPLWQTEGRPVSLGRSVRTVPPHLARLVRDRDGCCLFPACFDGETEAHHLIHWLDGGPTDPPNLGSLCSRHHDALHAGAFSVTGNAERPETLRFIDRRGREIPAVGRPAPPRSLELPAPPAGHSYRHPAGERVETRWVWFPPAPEPLARTVA
jgi:hypothetical protein